MLSNRRIVSGESSAASTSSDEHPSASSSESEFALPSLKYLLDLPQKLFRIEQIDSSGSSINRDRKTDSCPPSVNNASKWLLMSASGLIEEVSVGRQQVVTADFISGCCNILLHSLEASPAVRDDRGFSVIHWLVFDALRQSASTAPADSASFQAEYGVQFRHKEPPALWAMICGGITPGDNELAEPHLGDLWRYRCEPALLLLVEQSIELGFRGSLTSLVEYEEYYAKPSLLDLADFKHGNTPLHYAVAFKRVDVVSLLLRHGASIHVKNAAGVLPFDMVEFDGEVQRFTQAEEIKATMPQKSSHSEPPTDADASDSVADFNPNSASIYSSQTHVIERRWGITDHLRIDQCSYTGESNGAAVKRLLFQRELNFAVNAGDDGNLAEVTRLVDYWTKQRSDGKKKMYPLVYRADVDLVSPLQTASVYLSSDVSILRQLLRLPHAFHVQSDLLYPATTLAAISNNLPATWMLQRAGFNINCRDVSVGKTCLHAVAEMPLIRDADQMEDDGITAVTETYVCDYMRQLIAAGADPLIVDDLGNTPLHVAAHRGLPGVAHLLIQWNAAKCSNSSASGAAQVEQSTFLLQQNVYGNTPLHYAFYTAHESDSHVACLSLLLSLGLGFSTPTNKKQLSPLQLFAGFDTDRGKRICKDLLQMTEVQLRNIVKPTRKRTRRNVLMSDISLGKERFKIPVVTEFEVDDDDVASIKLRSQHYVSKNRFKQSSDPFVKIIEPIDSSITVLEALEDQRKSEGQSASSESKYSRSRAAPDGFSPESLNKFTTNDDNPQETRRLLDRGLGFVLEIRMTAQKGFALFCTTAIPKGALVCEFVGELLNIIEADRRRREYRQIGLHQTIHSLIMWSLQRQVHGLYNLNRDEYVIDQFEYANVSHFISHSCEPNLVCLRVLENSRAGIYALRHIAANSELTLDHANDREKRTIQGSLICFCDSEDCQRTLL